MTTTAPRRRMPRADRRDQLIGSAEAVFVEKGFGGSSMEDVADRAGVTKPVLYDHFGSKDGLLAAVVERAGEELLALTAAASATAASSEQALLQGLVAYFRFVDAHAGAWTVLLREAAPGSAASQAMERVRQTQVDAIAALVAESMPGRDSARAAVYAHAVSGAAERLSQVRLTGRRMSAERAAALLMDVMWCGFERLAAGERWA